MLIGFLGLVATMPILAADLKIPHSPQPAWTVPVGLHPMYRYQSPRLDNGRLFFIAHNDFRNHLYSIDARNGAILWKSAFRATRVDLFPDDSLRVFTVDRYYLGLHAQTGKEFDANDLLPQPGIYETNFHPVYADSLTLMTAPTGELVALSPKGQEWKANPGWGSSIDAIPPVSYKDLVLTGASHSTGRNPGGLKAFNRRIGALAWTAADVKDATAIKLHGDVVLVYEGHWSDPNTFTPMVRALDAATGKQLWADSTMIASGAKGVTVGWPVEKSQSEGEVLILPCAGTARVVDLHSGVQKSRFALTSPSFAFSQGVVYAPEGNQVIGVDPASGNVVWRSTAFAGRPLTPVAGDGFVYAGDRRTISAWAVQ